MDFLISPELGYLKENDIIEKEFQFSGSEDNDDSGSDVFSAASEDSMETLNGSKSEDLMTAASPLSNVAKKVGAKSVKKPLSSGKRSAGSPLSDNEGKKSRARTKSMVFKEKLNIFE